MTENHMKALSAEALARRLSVSLRHIRRMDAAGKLPQPVRIGRAVRWLADDVEAWLAAGAPSRSEWLTMKSKGVNP